jgi:metallophosphoesterase (TIGR03767 family)
MTVHPDTTQQTLIAGEPIRVGTIGAYRPLALGPGEPHRRRLDLAPGASPGGTRRSLLRFLQCTDVHLVDWQSPGRFEFAQRYFGTGPIDVLLPSYRPQECLQQHAVAAMLGTVSRLGPSPLTGAPLQFFLCTGDYVDNMQENELSWWLALMAGREVRPGSGDRMRDGVATAAWNDPAYWCPEPWPDHYKEAWGFPALPGLLEETRKPFLSPGADLPWLAGRGNHDLLLAGTAPPSPAYRRLVTGAVKARLLAREVTDRERELDQFIRRPEAFLSGPAALITPDPRRALYEVQDWLQAHAAADGQPEGHGFTPDNLVGGTAYYVDDRFPGIRLIMLDTVNPGGHYTGSIDAAQHRWLEARLIEAHAGYWGAGGGRIVTGKSDRLVILISHHGLTTLTNDRLAPEEIGGPPRVLAAELRATLHRFPNLVLWINGHTHENRVRARPDPASPGHGFWEVTTSSQIDWPCQTRLFEVVDNGNGTLSLFTTMVDHAAPTMAGDGDGFWRLAARHRELAANDPDAGSRSANAGTVLDRNVELVVRSPLNT